jgi:Prolipoprotein diacylglyceryl transferase
MSVGPAAASAASTDGRLRRYARLSVAFIPSPSSNGFYIGPLFVHAYGLAYVVAVAAAIFITRRRWAARGGDPALVGEVVMWAFPAGLVKQPFKRPGSVLELDRPDPGATPALACQQTLVREPAHRLADRLTRHAVRRDQLLIGGKPLIELARAQPARQIAQHLRP